MPITTAAFDWVRTVVEADAAIVLDNGKEYLVESRLSPLARAAGSPDVSAFVDKLRSTADSAARDRVVEALTTNETSWFRDGGPFAALENTIVPALCAQRSTMQNVRVWSAACSTGQEPYSIAMILRDTVVATGGRCQILATDLSPAVLAQAKQGRYNQVEMNRGLPANRLVSHFKREGMRWQASEDLRRMIKFEQMNLARPFPAIGPFDVIFLRNVLIYFSIETRREILRRVRQVCHPNGYLILGSAETTLGVDEKWTRTQIGTTSVYRPLR
jgi:chemotaxis protein methyltransferase CheR